MSLPIFPSISTQIIIIKPICVKYLNDHNSIKPDFTATTLYLLSLFLFSQPSTSQSLILRPISPLQIQFIFKIPFPHGLVIDINYLCFCNNNKNNEVDNNSPRAPLCPAPDPPQSRRGHQSQRATGGPLGLKTSSTAEPPPLPALPVLRQ